MYTLLLTFKGERGGKGGGRSVRSSSSSGADRPESFRRGGSGGAREAVEAPGKEAPETSRSFGGVSWLRQHSSYLSVQQGVKHI